MIIKHLKLKYMNKISKDIQGNAVLPLVSKRVYHYRISSTHSNSDKYGVCEICKKHASEVFMQSEQRDYFNPITNEISQTYADCRPHTFGHEQCLLSIQR